MDRGARWAAIYGVAQSRTRLKRLSSSREYLGGEMSGRKNKWLFEFVEQARSLFWVNKSVSHHKRENFGFDRDIEIVGKERRAEQLFCYFQGASLSFITMLNQHDNIVFLIKCPFSLHNYRTKLRENSKSNSSSVFTSHQRNMLRHLLYSLIPSAPILLFLDYSCSTIL